MSTLRTCAAIGLSVLLPLAASAQSSDAQYCAELSHAYSKYISSGQDKRPRNPPANVSEAMSKCQTDSASAIPVLEKALTNAKVELPKHN